MVTLVEALQDCGALQFGEFTLTSGRTSRYYVDIKRAVTRPEVLRQIVEGMRPHAAGYDRLAGTELGAVPLVVALALATSLPYVMVRKEGRTHGTQQALEGELRKGERILLVEDVTTTGGTVRRAVDLLREAGAEVDRVVCVVDRQEGAAERLGEAGVEVVSLVARQELLQE